MIGRALFAATPPVARACVSQVEVSTRMNATSSKRDHSAATVGFDIGQGSRYDEFIQEMLT